MGWSGAARAREGPRLWAGPAAGAVFHFWQSSASAMFRPKFPREETDLGSSHHQNSDNVFFPVKKWRLP